MEDAELSRRGFLQSAGALSAASLLKLSAPAVAAIAQAACSARDSESVFATLGSEEAADFAAIAARIIPTTDTPGATEAGVIHFFDQAFANEMSDSLEFARTGIEKLNDAIGDRRFSALDDDEQDSVLRAAEGRRFFEVMRMMTIFGFFAMSKYGGNTEHVGWDLIGFEGHQGAWLYPFGHYDAEVHAVAADDGE